MSQAQVGRACHPHQVFCLSVTNSIVLIGPDQMQVRALKLQVDHLSRKSTFGLL